MEIRVPLVRTYINILYVDLYRGLPFMFCHPCAASHANMLQDEDVIAAYLRLPGNRYCSPCEQYQRTSSLLGASSAQLEMPERHRCCRTAVTPHPMCIPSTHLVLSIDCFNLLYTSRYGDHKSKQCDSCLCSSRSSSRMTNMVGLSAMRQSEHMWLSQKR